MFEAIRQALAGRHYVTPLICKEPVGVFVARAKAGGGHPELSARQREVLQKDAPFHEMTVTQWDQVMNVNLRGAFLCSREAVREFLRRGVRPGVSVAAGKIIFISSVHEVIPWAGHVNYAASKGGLMLLMKSLAQEVAELRIRVNSIAPGAIRTPINTGAWQTQEAYTELMKLIPYKRIGEVDEIGSAAVWLASDFTDYIVGSTIYIDGGMTLYPGFETGG